MIKNDDNYLTGKCLIAMPNMNDERFAGSLIYICSHTKDGAMGFVVNKKIKEFVKLHTKKGRDEKRDS